MLPAFLRAAEDATRLFRWWRRMQLGSIQVQPLQKGGGSLQHNRKCSRMAAET